MADTSKLTKQQLLELLKKHEEEETATVGVVGSTETDQPKSAEEKTVTSKIKPVAKAEIKVEATSPCQFKPKKAGTPACTEAVSTPYGYCKAHKSSVQGMNARKVYEAAVFEKENGEKIKAEAEKKAAELVKEQQRKKVEEDAATKAAEEEKKREAALAAAKAEEAKRKEEEIKAIEEKRKADEVASKKAPAAKVQSQAQTQSPATKKKAVASENLEFVEPPPQPIKRIKIRANRWGRFEEPESHIVFDPVEKTAIGIQDHKSGRVLSLDSKAIEHCKKNLWKYKLRVTQKEPEPESEEEPEGEEEEATEEEPDGVEEIEEPVEEPTEIEEPGEEEAVEENEEEEVDEDEDEGEEEPEPTPPPRPSRNTVSDVRSTRYANLRSYGASSPLTPKRR